MNISLFIIFLCCHCRFFMLMYSFFCYLLSFLMWKRPHQHGVECWTDGTLLRPRMKKGCSSLLLVLVRLTIELLHFLSNSSRRSQSYQTSHFHIHLHSFPPQPKCVHMIIKRKCSIFIIFSHLIDWFIRRVKWAFSFSCVGGRLYCSCKPLTAINWSDGVDAKGFLSLFV